VFGCRLDHGLEFQSVVVVLFDRGLPARQDEVQSQPSIFPFRHRRRCETTTDEVGFDQVDAGTSVRGQELLKIFDGRFEEVAGNDGHGGGVLMSVGERCRVVEGSLGSAVRTNGTSFVGGLMFR
jgi:hypothetical protein